MGKRQILVVGEEKEILDTIREALQDGNTEIYSVDSAAEVFCFFMEREYCLVIMDIHPKEPGRIEILHVMRTVRSTPVLALTTPLNAEEKVALLHAGADAYIEKPLDPDVCAAQANALIQLYLERKHELSPGSHLAFGGELVISPRFRQVFVDGRPLSLTRKEFDLLHYLASHPGQVFSREQLYQYVWEESFAACGEDTVKTHIKNLRKKLASVEKSYIQNVWGTGYRFILSSSEKK